MLPQCVLCPPPRRGRKHQRAAAAYTVDRMQRWLEGERQSLWAARPEGPRRLPRERTAEERRSLSVVVVGDWSSRLPLACAWPPCAHLRHPPTFRTA
jgi:hypothetical protein